MFISLETRRKGKRTYQYYILYDTAYNTETKRTLKRYIASLGREPVLSRETAERICEQFGYNLDDLRNVKGLQIAGEPVDSIQQLDFTDDAMEFELLLMAYAIETQEPQYLREARNTRLMTHLRHILDEQEGVL